MANYSIHVKNFSKSFGDLKAVDNLSFDVNEGEIFAFLGANGSGKTTTIRCLLKIYEPDEGELLINDSEYNEDFNSLIGYLPEERGLYKDVSILDILVYTAVLRNVKKEEALSRSIKYLKKVDLYDYRDKEIAKLSSGMQQKVQLGTALIHEPEILVLDEPFKGLDPVNRQFFVDILVDRAKNGTTILYSTHVIDEAQKMADALLIIKDGKSLEYGNVEKVREKYGSRNIMVDFVDKAPEKDNRLYSAIITNKRAEISPKSDVDSNEIIKNLLSQGVKIVDMTLDYPSLNQIFIKLMKR